MTWEIHFYGEKSHLVKPILIEGMPGIGNVGKIVVDFLIDELHAKKIAQFTSNTLPHSVFIDEDNVIEMPTIDLYLLKRSKRRDLLLLTGDVQPSDEVSCHQFCEAVLDTMQDLGCRELVTIGGIGLATVGKVPKVYCTGSTKKGIADYVKGTKLLTDLYGVVGPIVGVSGLLVGLAQRREIPAICLLAETIGHPMYLGMRGAKEVLKVLAKKTALSLPMKKIDEEIKNIEESMEKHGDALLPTDPKFKKLQAQAIREVNYIG